MKNITYILIMTFLFGSLIPSGQAYANGKKHIEFNKLTYSSIFNEDLVDRLAKSENFKYYFNCLYSLASITSYNLTIQSENDRKQSIENLETVIKTKNVDLNDASNAIGFKIDKPVIDRMNQLKEKLVQEFPELVLKTQVQRVDIINLAITKGDLVNKFFSQQSRACSINAVEAYSNCIHDAKWWRVASKACMVTGYVAAIVCAIGVAASTAGTATAAALASLATICTAVGTVCGAFFGFTSVSGTTLTNCKTAQLADLKSCDILYGTEATGGAE